MIATSINVGKARSIPAKSGQSGIYKEPVVAPVTVSATGLDGDTIVDTEHHGGTEQAVYIYCEPDYEWWRNELRQDFSPGTFGENITLDGIENAAVCIGDRFVSGDLVLEVTSPRIPCVTLGMRMGDPGFVKKFSDANRTGFYCRVLASGTLTTGVEFEHTPYTGECITIPEAFAAFPLKDLDIYTVAKFLSVPFHKGGIAKLKMLYS